MSEAEDVYDPYKTGGAQPKEEPTNGVAADQLRSVIERIERLEEEKKAIADDIKDVYGEAKANGYDTTALRKIVALRKIDANEREERAAIVQLYANALGMTGVFA